MTQDSNDLHFFYDAQGKPGMVRFNGVDYFYVYNRQGDVVALIDADGTQVVEYIYDAWGNPISKTGTLAATLGTLNPFRYRGYVYDEETGLYDLRSRYYNPVWKRFINADALVSSGQNLFDKNMFAYCYNSPTVQTDPFGQSAIGLVALLVVAAFSLTGCSASKESPPWDYKQSVSQDQNCYGYAFGIMSNKNPGDIAFDIDKSLDVVSKEYRTVSGIAALVEADMIKNGREVRIVNSPDEAKENEYIVALKTTTSPIFFDYHFARRLSDGT